MSDTRKVRLKQLNPFISCYICKGYLIDATTVIECLHTFCRSCLFHYFEDNTDCPKCKTLIHQSHPSHYVSFDRTMQDIVYKLVPNLQTNERKRREKFFSARGIPFDSGLNEDDEESQRMAKEKALMIAQETDYHRKDEQVNIALVQVGTGKNGLKSANRSYIRCSVNATIALIRKFIAKQIFAGDMNRFQEIDILCNDELMGKDHSIKFILVTRWRTKVETMLELQYRKHIEL